MPTLQQKSFLKKDGKPVAKIINLEEWDEIMDDLKHQTKLDEAIKSVEKGEVYSFEEGFGHKQQNL